MPGVVIGRSLNNGFPGQYAAQPDEITSAFPNTGDAAMVFGSAVFGFNGGVAVAGSTGLTPTAANFKGVAKANVKTANAYNPQSLGGFAQSEPVPVFERGAICVFVSNSAVNAPAIDGPVYIRVAGGTATTPVNGFETIPDATTPANTILLTNATWGSRADSNGVAELVLKTRNNS